ncbi:MAG: FHA domain-containing protein [Acidimicrobiia bacterium]
MPTLFLNLLKLIFIALIYLFLWQVARAIAAHVGPTAPSRRRPARAEVTIVHSESQAGLRFPIRQAVVLGRSPEADIVLEDPYASDFHTRLGVQDGRVTLHDLGSTNGTYVNGRRATTPTVLSKGDAIQIGKTIMEVR